MNPVLKIFLFFVRNPPLDLDNCIRTLRCSKKLHFAESFVHTCYCVKYNNCLTQSYPFRLYLIYHQYNINYCKNIDFSSLLSL